MVESTYKMHNLTSTSEVGNETSNYGQALPRQKHQPGSASRHHVFRLWSWEIMSLALAVGILAAIYAILSHFNGQEIPRWPLMINLNTLIALLSTIFRSTTLVAVAAVIGQLRWLWFLEPRPLLDLHRIDSASYSALGSFRLLLQAPQSALIILGAIITITSLAVGPFMQQSIRTFTCDQHLTNINASLPAAHYFFSMYSRIGAGEYDLDFSMKGNMINALTDPQGSYSDVPVMCPTGNCTFQAHAGVTHSSIGLCSSCIDTTSAVIVGGSPPDNFSLPNGLSIAGHSDTSGMSVSDGLDDLNWASSTFIPGFATKASQSILNVSVLTFTTASCDESPLFGKCSSSFPEYVVGFPGGNLRPLAVSCAFYPCLKNYYASVVDSELNETLVSTTPASVFMEASDEFYYPGYTLRNYTAVKEPCVIDSQIYYSNNFSAAGQNRSFETVIIDGTNVSVPYECLYKFDGLSARALNLFMSNSLFPGSCAGNDDLQGVLHCPSGFWLESFWGDSSSNITTISTLMDRFTTAVTNKIREVGTSLYYNSDRTNMTRSDVLGVVNNVTVCTQFDWPWLILPTALLALSVLLLVAMMITNYRRQDQPVWKASSLPLLFYSFTDDTAISEKLDEDQLEEIAKRTHVQFRTGRVTGFERVIPDVEMRDIDPLIMESTADNGNNNRSY